MFCNQKVFTFQLSLVSVNSHPFTGVGKSEYYRPWSGFAVFLYFYHLWQDQNNDCYECRSRGC